MVGSITVSHRVKEGEVNAETLSTINVADVLCIAFKSDKNMARYRRLVYSINKQAEFRYRTIRSDGGMWELLILRLK
jgi:hypothetical protein